VSSSYFRQQTFLVDIDLSSLNKTQKASAPGSKTLKTPKRVKTTTISIQPENDDLSGNMTPEVEVEALGSENQDQIQDTAISDLPGVEETPVPFPINTQILDLNSNNPIISYYDQLYSCIWTDMVGTNMFFSQPDSSAQTQALHSTAEYDLLATSRIKLVGHPITTKKTVQKKRARSEESDGTPSEAVQAKEGSPEAQSLGSLPHRNPKANAQIRKQAAFLERLMSIKDGRGEADAVRTYVDEDIASHSQLNDLTSATLKELNGRVIKGDADAITETREAYARLKEQPSSETLNIQHIQNGVAP
jgi:hypothetical protein